MWAAFLSLVAALLALDLGDMHRKNGEIGVRESLALPALYAGVRTAPEVRGLNECRAPTATIA